MRSRRAAVLGVLLLLATSSSAAAASSGGAETSAGAEVARGRVLLDGRPVAGEVAVRVWPAREVLGALPEGGRFRVRTLATVRTDGDGRFVARLPGGLPASYVGTDGDVDVELVASDGVTATAETFTALPGPGAPGRRPWTSGAASGPGLGHTVTLDLGAGSAARLPGLRVASGAPLAGRGTAPARALGMDARVDGRSSVPVDQCWSYKLGRHGPYAETFATFYGSGGAQGRVVHDRNTTHTIGVGVKLPGRATWSGSGSRTVKSSIAYDSGFTIADAHVANRIWQRYYETRCSSAGTVVETTRYTMPDGFADGPVYTRAPHVDFRYCSQTYAGHTYSRVSNLNATYSAGVDLGFVSLSAQSGWSRTTEMHWKFARAGWLCGDTGLWTVARRVSART